jgi:hypothetical protein
VPVPTPFSLQASVLGGAHGADHDFLELFDLQGIRLLGGSREHAGGCQQERHRGVQ